MSGVDVHGVSERDVEPGSGVHGLADTRWVVPASCFHLTEALSIVR